MTDCNEYMTMDEAAQVLGVRRPTLYYYVKRLNLDTKKFDLDKHRYIKVADVERIKALKNEATERQKKDDEAA